VVLLWLLAQVLDHRRAQNHQSLMRIHTVVATLAKDPPTNESFNGLTHGFGLLLAMFAVVMLWPSFAPMASSQRSAWGATIFSVSMVGVYAASVAFHCASGAYKTHCAKFDHCAIYLLIAGTYSAFGTPVVFGGWDTLTFACIWVLALTGAARELTSAQAAQPKLWSYLITGWIVLAAALPLIWALPDSISNMFLLGGVCYTLGIPFYRLKQWRNAHGVWHLFVLSGSAAHFYAVLQYRHF
jgi:hemolysin III